MILLLTGVATIAIVVFDILMTTLHLAGGGPVSEPVTRGVWRCLLKLRQLSGARRFHSFGGLFMLTVLAVFWGALYFGGWLLVFFSDTDAVVNASTSLPADSVSRIYFTGYTVTTLGIGDFKPGTDLHQVMTVVAAAGGFILITLMVTYLLGVTNAVSAKRTAAAQISQFGCSAEQLLESGLRGESLSELSSAMEDINHEIQAIHLQYLTFPAIVHYTSGNLRYNYPGRIFTYYDFLLFVRLWHRARGKPAPSPVERGIMEVQEFARTMESIFHIDKDTRGARLMPFLNDERLLEAYGVSSEDLLAELKAHRDCRATLEAIILYEDTPIANAVTPPPAGAVDFRG